MKRGLLVALAALALAAAVHASTLAGPSLRIERFKPLVAQGSRFRPAERIRVELTSGRKHEASRLTANRAGSFFVELDTITVDRCSAFVVSAVGSRGSTATLRHRPLPQCLPARTP